MRKQAVDSLVVSALSAVALAMTLVLYRIVTRRFGPGETDAFFLAFGALNVVIAPLYNAIGSTLVPRIVRHRAERVEELPALLGATVAWVALGSVTATVLVAALAGDGLRLTGTILPPQTAQLFRQDVLILGPVALFSAVGAVLAAASHAAGRYWVPAAAGLCQQVLTVGVVTVGLPVRHDTLLPLAFTLGALGYLVFLIAARPRRELPIKLVLGVHPDLSVAVRLAVPIVCGTVAIQLALLGLRVFAARLTPGAVTAFDLAYRVSSALVDVSASGALAVVLTQWSAAVASGQASTLRSRLRDTLALVLFVILPVPIALHALREPLVQLWLSSHAVDAAVRGMTIAALGVLLLGVPLDIASRLYVRVLLAQERTRVLGWLSLQRMILTLVLAWLLVPLLAIRGVSLAEVVSIAATLAALHLVATHRDPRPRLAENAGLLRLAVIAAVSWSAGTFLSLQAGHLPLMSQCAICIVAIFATYIGAARLVRMPELSAVAALLRRMPGRLEQSPVSDFRLK